MVEIYLPFPPEPDDEDVDDEVIALDLFSDLSLEGVTSGADSTAWDPIRIEREAAREESDDVLDTDLKSDGQPGGVTSGNDSVIDGNVKSSERKNRQR